MLIKSLGKKLLLFSILVFINLNATLSAQQSFENKIDSLNKALLHQNTFEKANTYQALSTSYFSHDSLLVCHKIGTKGIELAIESKNYTALANLYRIRGYVYTAWGNYPKAIEFFTKAINIGQKSGDLDVQIAGFHGMGRVYNELNDNKQAERAFLQSLNLINDKNNDSKLRAIFNDLGVLYMKEKEYKKSIDFLEKSMAISLKSKDSASYIFALVNIGEVYRFSGNLKKAENYYLKAIDANKYLQSVQGQAAAMGNLAHVYFKRKEYQKAIEYYNKSIAISDAGGLINFMVESYKSVSDLYLEMGDYKNSLQNLVRYDELKDSIFNQSKINEIKNLQIQFEIDRKNAETKYWRQKFRNRNIVLLSSIALIVFIVIILILLYSRFKLHQRLHLIEKKALSFTIDERNRELVGLMLNSSRKENLFEDLTKTIDNLEKNLDPENLNHAINEIKSRLKSDVIEENNWESVKVHFEQVHPEYLNNLKKLHPSLSQSDLRMCAYIKINMSSKDIASLMNVGLRAVQTSRYRLKKKLKLSDTEDLIMYLQNI